MKARKVTTMRFLTPLTLLAILLSPVFSEAQDALPAPVTHRDYHDDGAAPAAKVELGRLLFFDKILSGNRNISCATCHHPEHSSGDGVALAFGEGARGLGPARRPGSIQAEAVHERVPRNAPALFNLGAREFTRMYHDGRVELDTHGYYEGGFITPAKWKLPAGLDNVLAAQAMFPVTSPTEMAGQKGENAIANARSLNKIGGANGVWDQLAKRLQENAEYVKHFQKAFPERVSTPADITFVQAANAIAAFESMAFRSDDSPFDRYLGGDKDVLSSDAVNGMKLFYGRANCSSCHSGKFQTDHDFHSIAMPQIGPGKSDGTNGDYWRATGINAFVEDFGRGRVTSREADNFRFRTPSLRNVELTGPWGHAGAYDSLEAVVRHHLAPVQALEQYATPKDLLSPMGQLVELSARGATLRQSWMSDQRQAGFLRRDTWVQENRELRQRIASSSELEPVELSDQDVADLVEFLRALTDRGAQALESLTPGRVPSGLAIPD